PVASVVAGKPNFTNSTAGTTQSVMRSASGVAFSPDGNVLIAADENDHRVLIWNSIPASNGGNAVFVIGQTNFTSNTQGLSSTQLRGPAGVFVSPNGKLFICDQLNNRVLIYNSIPTSNGEAADVVVGQPNFTSNGTGIGANQMN